MKRILVIDGQGGRLGRQLVKDIAERWPRCELMAVGTNSIAAENMLKAGAARAATGENAAIVACRRADIILGPIGIVLADGLLGEVTPEMARAVGQSAAFRILIPSDRCETWVAGVPQGGMSALVEDALEKLAALLERGD